MNLYTAWQSMFLKWFSSLFYFMRWSLRFYSGNVWRHVFLLILSLLAVKMAHFWVDYETQAAVYFCSFADSSGSILNAFPLVPLKQKACESTLWPVKQHPVGRKHHPMFRCKRIAHLLCNTDHSFRFELWAHRLMLHFTSIPKMSNNIQFFLLSHSGSTRHLFLCATKTDWITLSVVLFIYVQCVSWLLETL